MSFLLTPLYLAGILAVSLPILFHLFRRTPKGRMVFSSLMFLSPSPPRLTRRSRLENLPLLLLRALILILLALAFSRPFWREVAEVAVDSSRGQWLVLAVDTSASMQREDLWKQALSRVDAILAELKPLDRVSLIAFDRQVRPLVDFSTWNQSPEAARKSLITDHLAKEQPTWYDTNLASALITAAESIEEAQSRSAKDEQSALQTPKRVVLISDLQQGSALAALQGFDWPEGVELRVERVSPRRPTNAALQLAVDASAPWTVDDKAGPRIRVTNAADSDSEQFRIRWVAAGEGTKDGAASDVYVPPGQSRIVQAPVLPAGSAAGCLALEGDAHEFDNRTYLVAPRMQQLKVLFVGHDQPTDTKQPLYYLLPVFPDSAWRKVTVTPQLPDAEVLPGDLDKVPLVIVAAAMPSERIAWVRRYAEQGGTVLCVLHQAEQAETLSGLLESQTIEISEAVVSDYAMLTDMDFRHPLFAALAEPLYRDFTKIHFWHHRRLDPQQLPKSRILAKFDDGDPALLELGIGSGTLFVLTAGWHPADSQLALSSKFVPILHGLLEFREDKKQQPAQHLVGDLLQWQQPPTTATAPGLFQLSEADRQPYAVNLAAAESRTAPLAVEELEKLGVRLMDRKPELPPEQLAAMRRQMLAVELENRQKLWRWLIALGLAAVLLETWWSGWLTRRAVAASS